MASGRNSLDDQVEKLRQRLTEKGVKVLSGNWGGKGGIARYKGQWLVVMDRHLPANLKFQLLQAMCQLLQGERTGEPKGDGDGKPSIDDPS